MKLHLPDPILGSDVALGEEEVVGGLGVDVGNAPPVPVDGNRGIQSWDLEFAGSLGKGPGEEVPVPPNSGQDQHQPEKDPRRGEQLGRATHSPGLSPAAGPRPGQLDWPA